MDWKQLSHCKMKFVYAFAVLFIGAVSAQVVAPPQNNRPLVESLEARAAALLQRVHAVFAEHRGQFNHLLQNLDRQAILVEALALDLKTQLANPGGEFHAHHIHVIEEDLLHLENRVSEEIAIINHVRAGNDNRGENGQALINRGQQLVKDAQAAVTAHPQAKEAKEIQSEIIVVESLIKAIQAKPAPTAADLQKDEQELARQERTLRQLIEKANGRRN